MDLLLLHVLATLPLMIPMMMMMMLTLMMISVMMMVTEKKRNLKQHQQQQLAMLHDAMNHPRQLYGTNYYSES
jgi:hypothetical protein